MISEPQGQHVIRMPNSQAIATPSHDPLPACGQVMKQVCLALVPSSSLARDMQSLQTCRTRKKKSQSRPLQTSDSASNASSHETLGGVMVYVGARKMKRLADIK